MFCVAVVWFVGCWVYFIVCIFIIFISTTVGGCSDYFPFVTITSYTSKNTLL